MKKFTFKKDAAETGLAAVGRPYPNTFIKLGGKKVGVIAAPIWSSPDKLWRVQLMVNKTVTDDNPNCSWKWRVLKMKFETEPEARAFIQQNAADLQKLNLREDDDA